MTRRGIILVLIVALCILWQNPANTQVQSPEELVRAIPSSGNHLA
jgi:hypothetical protein